MVYCSRNFCLWTKTSSFEYIPDILLPFPDVCHTMQLPCGHEYCKSCMVQLREKGVAQTCPLCRKPLPPSPDKLYDLGYRIYAKIAAEVEPDCNASWEHISLSPAQQRGMDQSRALFLEAAAQGHMRAQANCGDIYWYARGVAKNEHLALIYYEMAAEQGCSGSQGNVGIYYFHGLGYKQSYEKAAEWLEKAACQNDAEAMATLGALYANGLGVPQNKKRAVELFQQSRALGNTSPIIEHNLGVHYEHGHGVVKDYLEARRFHALASAQGFAQAADLLPQIDEKIRTECPLLGKRVRITGTSREDMNGRAGVAASFDHARGRYVVELDDAGEKEREKLRLKPGNLVLAGRKGKGK